MRYELLLQPPSIQDPFDAGALDEILAKRAGFDPVGRTLKLPSGTVELKPLIEGGRQVAVELHLPLNETSAVVREVLEAGNEIAQAAGLVLFDPQLIRPVTVNDTPSVSEQYERTARYAGNFSGVSSALGAAYPMPTTGMRASTKAVIGIGLFFVALYFAVEYIAAHLNG